MLDMPRKRKSYQNTYKLSPDEKPPTGKIREVMSEIVKGTCEEQDFVRASSSNVVLALTTELQRRIKSLCPKRHRSCLQTFFVQSNDQGKHNIIMRHNL